MTLNNLIMNLQLWGMQSTPSLPSMLGPLLPEVVVPDRVPSMGQIEINFVLMLTRIIWNRIVFTFNCGFWDTTNHTIRSWIPDLLSIKKENRTCHLVDFAVRLEYWEESWRLEKTYHSNSNERPSANAGVKNFQKSMIIRVVVIIIILNEWMTRHNLKIKNLLLSITEKQYQSGYCGAL